MVRADIKTEYLKAKRALFDKKYAFLNEKQREAVFTVDGPLLVLAGAGTGKTTVLTERIGFILKYGNAYYSETVPVGADEQSIKELRDALDYTEEELDTVLDSLRGRTPNPWNVIAITFTNKAAGEMKTRLGKIVGDKVGELWCGTFHSMCLRILRANAEAAGYRSGFTVYD